MKATAEKDNGIPAEFYGLRRGTVTALTVICVLFALFTLVPIVWLIINSTKTQANIFESFGFWFARPFEFVRTFSNLFSDVDGDGTYAQWFGNTVIYSVVSGVGATALAALAGYGFARFRFAGSRLFFGLIIAGLLVPITLVAVPLFLVYAKVHLINSMAGMILPSMVYPVGVYLMRTYVELSIPAEITDAARVDGASELRIFFRVVLPLMVPGLMTVLLLSIAATWNNYILPLIIFSNNRLFPGTVGIGLWLQHAGGSGDNNLYPLLVLGGLVMIIPMIALFAVLQRYWRGGMLLGERGELMAAITLENLSKTYPGGVRALDGLDLGIADGEFTVLVGPSGCGKTTALRMVAGLERVTGGTIRFGGTPVNDVSPRHRDVAMVFQNYALYPHLTVAENLGFALRNKRVPKAEREAKIHLVAEVLGLSRLLGRTPDRLSGGQRQRVAMGRAIIREPAVFCMDEPLSNLDAKLRVALRAEIVRVHRSIGAATLYVTHDQVEAMTMGDRVAVLDLGLLQQYGPPRSLYDHPANLFVASFIGSPEMNLWQGALTSDGDLMLGSQRLALAEPPAALGPYRGHEVIAGIRPEALAPPGEGAALAGDVRVVDSVGSEAHAFFAIDAPAAGPPAAANGDDGGGLLARLAWNGVARVDTRLAPRAGERATFAVDTGRLHFFDPVSGQAIR